ncbi:MAG: flagellar export protein FliJ [Bacillota bacterium]|jgi:flagellar export protein FliJ
MKRFSFRFQPVLNVRAARRDARERELAQLLGEVDEARNKLKIYHSQLNQLVLGTVGENPGALINQEYYRETVSQNIREQNRVLREKEQLVGVSRKELLKAEQELRSMEIIKEKEISLYRQLAAQEEQKFLDETGTGLFLRSRENG